VVDRPHDADASVHQEVPALSGLDQDLGCGLPFLDVLFGLGSFMM
jgi:hypothetical protein